QRETDRTTWGRTRLCPRCSLLIFILLSAGLNGCASSQSVERVSGGPPVYLDQLSDTAKAEARREIVQHLSQDVAVFHVAIGDEFKVFFDPNPEPTQREYLV